MAGHAERTEISTSEPETGRWLSTVSCAMVALSLTTTTHAQDADDSRTIAETQKATNDAMVALQQAINDVWNATEWIAVAIGVFTMIFILIRGIAGRPIGEGMGKVFAALILIQLSWAIVGMIATTGGGIAENPNTPGDSCVRPANCPAAMAQAGLCGDC